MTTTSSSSPTTAVSSSPTTPQVSPTTTPNGEYLSPHRKHFSPGQDHGPVGCYLVYEPNSGGRLMLQYSVGPVPAGAVGFWCPGPDQPIQSFKFKQAAGRSELIKGIAGGDANKRKYFVGWCQFIKLAKAKQGRVIQFTPEHQGVPVDVYGYNARTHTPTRLDIQDGLVSLDGLDAVAVMSKHHEFMEGVKSCSVNNFLELGNLAGATTLLT